VAVAALLALDGSATADPAASEPAKRSTDQPLQINDPVPAGFTSWNELHATQERLSAVSDRLHEALQTPDDAGFGSIVSEPAANQLRLYWKGALPASVRAVIAREVGVDIVVRPAAHSEAELLGQVDRLVASQAKASAAPATKITGAAPRSDASGLTVYVDRSAAEGRELPAVRALGVPVTVKGGVLPQAVSRANDSSPYWGGANWTGDGGCTTGFAVNHDGRTKMLSAAHCATNGINAYDGGGTVDDLMGRVSTSTDTKLDALLIDARAAGRVFNGGPGTGEFTNPVLGRHFNNVGDYVCTSGAYSGTRCNIKIVESGVTQTFTKPGGIKLTFSRLALAEQQDGLNAGGNGDSGGPVLEVGSDPTTVWAKGTLTGNDPTNAAATCTGVPASSTRKCSSRIWYTSVAQSLNNFGATIVTG
jgi:hypothetical protein